MLKNPEPVGIDDEVAPVVLDFWTNYISTISEEAFEYIEEDTKPDWLAKAASHVFMVISDFMNKVAYPDSSDAKSWDEESKKTFKAFRMDVRDSILESFNVLHGALLEQFVDFSIRALENNNWFELEAGLFALNSICDALTPNMDPGLHRLLERPLFTTMSTNPNIPAVTRRAVVETVTAFDSFFVRNANYLPQALPFLLSALAQPSLAHGAAKSFASLCSECRSSLTAELPSFFQMYREFIGYPTANETTKSRVLEGIAAIVQTQDSEEKQLSGLQELFQFIANDAMQAVSIVQNGGDPEEALMLANSTLKCLHAVGKSMQSTDEDVIDLSTDRKDPSTFWTEGSGKAIQNQVINFLSYFTQLFPNDSEIIEHSCDVLRVGFKESVPGPFVLPPSATINYILKTNVETPRLPKVLETACCWLSSYKNNQSSEYQAESLRLLHYIISLLQALQHPRNDPEVAVGCIELIQKFINVNPSIFASQPPDILTSTFSFTIEALKAPDPLPKRAAASLWKDTFELSDPSRNSQAQGICTDIVRFFGKEVVGAIVWNICGEVDGTSLEHVTIPLRKAMSASREAKSWVTEGLAHVPLIASAREMGGEEVEGTVRKFIEGLAR